MTIETMDRTLRTLPAPEPSAGIAAYRAERQMALAGDPRKRANYDRFQASSRRESKVDYLPVILDIENVSRCNFRCTMCVVSDWHKGQRAADLSLDDFKAIIDEQYGLVEIKLQGIGEPTMQGDDYFAMIRYARARHIWVRTTTNASLLHLRDNYRKLIDSDPNEIQISIDGADAETFESIRRGSVFHQVAHNCRTLHDYAEQQGVRRTKMWTVVQDKNLHQLEDLVPLAAELGFKHQCFSLELSNWGRDDWEERNKGMTATSRLDPDRLHDLIALGQRHGVDVRFWHVLDKYSTDTPQGLCPWPFERAVITSDRQVVPCCTIGDPNVLKIDDMAGKSFSEIWHGDSIEAFRQAHLDRKVPKECLACYRHQDGTDGDRS